MRTFVEIDVEIEDLSLSPVKKNIMSMSRLLK